jgi:hypothetical protein
MFINVKQIKLYIKEQDKQISKKGLEALNAKVELILVSAIRNTRNFKRVTDTEINYAKGG